MLTLEVIRDIRSLLGIKSEWHRLWKDLSFLTPFQSPEWLLTWWKHFGSGEMHVLVFRSSEGKIVGIIPCFRHEWDGCRQLTLIGSGISDFLEPAIAPEYRQEVVHCLEDHLDSDAEWDVCNWQDLSSDTSLAQLAANPTLQVELQPDLPCAEVSIKESFSAFWESRPRGLRRNVRRYVEKARQIDFPDFAATATQDRELLDALIRLHTARWQQQGERGMIAANQSAEFLREVAGELASQNMLLFFSIRFQGHVVAVILSFPWRNTLFSYLSAFDPEYQALGFGKLLLYKAMEYSFDQQYDTWNFLRGSEPYKADWGARNISKVRLIITREHS